VALKQENTKDHSKMLRDTIFYINTIRNYAIDLAAYKQHLHKELLQLTDQLIRYRDSEQLKSHTVKSKPILT
jgi:hypothetical protein